jgi:hypothetical protein
LSVLDYVDNTKTKIGVVHDVARGGKKRTQNHKKGIPWRPEGYKKRWKTEDDGEGGQKERWQIGAGDPGAAGNSQDPNMDEKFDS